MKNIYMVFLFVLLASGCAGKKTYDPQKIDSELSYSESSEIGLKDVARDVATYTDGTVITKSGVSQVKIPKDFRSVNICDKQLIITSNDGNVKILNPDASVKFETKFSEPLVSATLKGTLLAYVLQNNTIGIYDISEDRLVYKEPLTLSIAQDARLANPLFINDLVIFATLDGRLLFMNSEKKIVLRDVAISNKSLFNNVIYLDIDDKERTLVAATSSKAIVINPKSIHNKSIGIKDIIFMNEKIYIFTKNGEVVMFDETFEEIKRVKFPYAVFATVFENGKLYAVEKEGYLIEIEPDLSSSKVIRLPDAIDNSVFGANNKIYFNQHIINIK